LPQRDSSTLHPLLVCVSWTITGQPGNSIFICRVWPLSRQCEIPWRFAALLRGTRHVECYPYHAHTSTKYLYGCKYAAYNKQFQATFPWQDFFLTLPWLLVKSLTFPGFPGSGHPAFSFVRERNSTKCDIVRVLPQGHRSVSVSRHFLLQAPQCPCSVCKWFSRGQHCRGRSKPSCRIVGSHTRWELTT